MIFVFCLFYIFHLFTPIGEMYNLMCACVFVLARRSPPPAIRKRNMSPQMPDKRMSRMSPVPKRKRASPPMVSSRKASAAAEKGHGHKRQKRRSSSSGSGKVCEIDQIDRRIKVNGFL